MKLPSKSEARPKVVFHWSGSEELLSGENDTTEVRVSLELVGNARRLARGAAKCRHRLCSNDPQLVLKIEGVPQSTVGGLRLS